MAEDRNLLERAQDYLVSGDFDRDARYVLGPHLSKGLLGLAQLIGPGADIKAMVDESKRIVPSLKEGNISGALSSLGVAAAAPFLIGAPGDVGKIRKGTEEVKRYIDEPVDYKFTTGRGSTYEAFPSGKTQRDKAPGHRDGGVGLQRESEKTIFTDGSEQGRRTASDIVGISKSETPTQILPILSKSNKVVGIKLVHASDVGPKKVGDTILQMPVSTKPDVGKQPIEIFGQGTDVHVGSPITKIKKAEEATPENIPVMPVNQAKLEEKGFEFKPGGEYVNPKTNEILTGRNVDSASISITPEGKPKFDVTPIEKEIVGSPSDKGATQIKTNLFKKSAGWKWIDGPKQYKDIPTLVSVQNKGKHYYTLETNFPEGVNLTRYADSPSEPRLRPTVKGFVNLGKEIGKISVRGKEHPVYDKIINKYSGGQIKKGGSIIERNPYNYSPRSI